jgi:hypothetical protein
MKLAEEEWDQTNTRLAMAKTVNERRVESVRRTLSAEIGHCLLGGL